MRVVGDTYRKMLSLTLIGLQRGVAEKDEGLLWRCWQAWRGGEREDVNVEIQLGGNAEKPRSTSKAHVKQSQDNARRGSS